MALFDFLSLKKSVNAFAGQIKTLSRQIEQLKRERENIVTAPPALQDVVGAYERELDARRKSFRDGLARKIDYFQGQPGQLENPLPLGSSSLLALAHENYSIAPFQVLENGLAVVLGDQILRALTIELEALDWSKAGLPWAERRKRIADMDAQIERLEKELADLRTSAQEAGIIIDIRDDAVAT